MDIIQELQNYRTQLIQEINVTFDRIIQSLRTEQNPIEHVAEVREYETIYPLTAATGIFKGKKPSEVRFPDGTCVDVRTWKNVVEAILDKCNNTLIYHSQLQKLCGKVGGRERVFLARTGVGMRSPVKIDEEIYIETHYDTETLLRILTTRILDPIDYDYRGITITISGN